MESSMLDWQNQYSVGAAEIDNQHKRLFALLRELQGSLSQGIVNPVFGDAIKTLVDYTQTHFRDEEALMRRIDFPEYDRHAQLHKDLTIRVKNILLDLKAGKQYTPSQFIDFLRSWLVNHILREDSKIGRHYENQDKESHRSAVK